MFGRWMRAREVAHTKKDDNRIVRPFDWGAEFISEHVNGDDPRAIFSEHTRRVMAQSDEFFALPEIHDWQLDGRPPDVDQCRSYSVCRKQYRSCAAVYSSPRTPEQTACGRRGPATMECAT